MIMENEVKVVKAFECKSLSGLSTLTYEIGIRGGAEGVIRVAGNSGSGMFSDDWVPLREVLNILRLPLNQEAISSSAFRPLYLGRSINTPSFLMAALLNEEVIGVNSEKKRTYEVTAVSAFEERMEALLGNGVMSTTPSQVELPRKKLSVKAVNRAV
jgi:hypothetical protein